MKSRRRKGEGGEEEEEPYNNGHSFIKVAASFSNGLHLERLRAVILTMSRGGGGGIQPGRKKTQLRSFF